jgi:hypothetical protein
VGRPELVGPAVRIAIGSQQDAILVLDDEFAPQPGRATKILERCRQLDVGVPSSI